MSDDNAPDDLDQVDELSLLKMQAKTLGIVYSNNIGVDTLRAKIKAKLEDTAEIVEAGSNTPADEAATSKPVKRKTLRQHLQDEQMKLIRVRIMNLDPKKKNLHGEIFTVANEYIGTVKKFVPYGEVTDNGYHLPMILYKELDDRKFLNVRTIKGRNGDTTRVETNWVKEFAFEVLPPLTQSDLDKLATQQAAAGVFSAE